MKYLFLFVLAFFMSSGLYSQYSFLDLSAGANVSRIKGLADDQFKTGPAFGLGYEYRFGKIMSLRAGVMYNQRGGRYSTTLMDQNSQELYKRHFSVTSKYMSVPVLFGLVSTGETYVFGRLGVMMSYLRDATVEVPVFENGSYVAQENNIKQDFNQWEVMEMLEGGVGGAIGSRTSIECAVAMQIGLSNATRQPENYNTPSNTSSNSIQLPRNGHIGFSAMIALKYKLSKQTSE